MSTITFDKVREQLALRDVECIYKDRDLFELFLNGCAGWNNLDPLDCLVEYIEAFCEEENTRFIVEDNKDHYEIVIDLESSPTITINLNGVNLYNKN